MENFKKNTSILKCAVGIVFSKEKKILIAQRPPHKTGGGLWEFPGGKIEENESATDALRRELQEEIGITPLQFEEFMKVDFDYPEYSVALEMFLVHLFEGNPHGLEGQPIAWIKIEELENYPFLEGNVAIIKALKTVKGLG